MPNKQFRQLINIASNSLKILNTANKKFPSIEVWCTDQKSKQLAIEDIVNITKVIL